MQKLSWREKYAGVLVLIIGIISLLMQIASISSIDSNYTSQEGAFVINQNQLAVDFKTWLVIIMGVVAGYLLLKNKTLGWVLGLPVLLLFTSLILVLSLQSVLNTKKIDTSLTIPGIALFAMILGIAFLLNRSARKKYRVSNRLVILTLLLFAGIGSLYYFLQ